MKGLRERERRACTHSGVQDLRNGNAGVSWLFFLSHTVVGKGKLKRDLLESPKTCSIPRAAAG